MKMRTHLVMLIVLCMSVATANAQTTRPVTERPADAITLFDGKDLSKWEHRNGDAAKWELVDGAMQVRGGDIQTVDEFQDFKLHIEFMTPKMPDHVKGQGRGNSGVYLQSRYEIQVLDSYGLEKLEMGDCGSIYGHKIADVNASSPPETWQTYDIEFTAAKFDAAGKKTANARVTVYHNGQPIHRDVEITAPTGGGAKEGAEPGPIRLQDHGNPVRYRNIWIVPR